MILLLIAFIWLVIATYWTGNENTTKESAFPVASEAIIPAEISPTPLASSTAEIQLPPVSTASVDIDLRY